MPSVYTGSVLSHFMFVFYVRQFYNTRIRYCMSHVHHSHVHSMSSWPSRKLFRWKWLIISSEDRELQQYSQRPWRCERCSRRYCHVSSECALYWSSVFARLLETVRMDLRTTLLTTSLIIVDWPTEIVKQKKCWQFRQFYCKIICINILHDDAHKTQQYAAHAITMKWLASNNTHSHA